MFLKFVPMDAAFENHRFCESRHTINDQYNSNDVYLWNLLFNPFSGAEIPPHAMTTAAGESFAEQPQQVLDYFAANVPGTGMWPSNNPRANSPSMGYVARVFHPKTPGHKVMKDALIKALRTDKVPGVKPL